MSSTTVPRLVIGPRSCLTKDCVLCEGLAPQVRTLRISFPCLLSLSRERSRMNIGEVLSGRAKSNGVRWLLLSPTAQQVLADQVRALLPAGARVGPCRLREAARFKPGRGITAYYDAFVNTEGRQEDDVPPIAVTWGANTQEDRQAETVALARYKAERLGRAVAAPFGQLWPDFSEWT